MKRRRHLLQQIHRTFERLEAVDALGLFARALATRVSRLNHMITHLTVKCPPESVCPGDRVAKHLQTIVARLLCVAKTVCLHYRFGERSLTQSSHYRRSENRLFN